MKYDFKYAINIGEKYESQCKVWDNRIAAFRLFSSLALLAVFVHMGQGKNPVFIFILIVLFLIYCFVTSFFHRRHQNTLKLWTSYNKSYRLSQARVQRNFTFLENNVSPWHHKIATAPKNHSYASDIDLHHELFLFLNTCSTENGSRLLFQELLTAGKTPCNKEEIEKRITMASKLSQQLSLCRRFEALRLDDDFVKSFYSSAENSAQVSNTIHWRQLIFAFVSLLAWGFLFLPALWKVHDFSNPEMFLRPLFIYAIFILFGIYIYQPIVDKAYSMARETKYIGLIYKSVAQKKKINLPFSFLSPGSIEKIKRMNFIVDILSLRGNPIFWILIHIFFPFDAILCFILMVVVKSVHEKILLWKDEVAQFDFIMSLARLKSENPEFKFYPQSSFYPQPRSQLLFEGMGHPLLPFNKRVCNSFVFEKNSPLVLLTGSNMSGKSTFLRAFATNVLLANMGAPVCAKEFCVPQMKILCAIRIDDSLSDGTSYFYAEVKRLAEILKELKNTSLPGLFFVDEIFKGTNNKERYIGSLSILHAFLQSNAFGFVSTHDLALTELGANEPRLRNMHFREHIEGNELSFDYTLKEGPCPTTNALFIMRQAGLPIVN